MSDTEDIESETEPVPAPNTMTISTEEYQRLQRELAEHKDKYLRVLAEMENTRKRLIKEREEYAQQAIADVIHEFLKPLDHMEKALHFADKMSTDVQNWAKGFQMILTQFKDVLVAHGVTAVEAHGESFDPHIHEAIEMEETEHHEPGTIVEEFTRGYKLGNRTIRPARVKVAKKKQAPQENTEAAAPEENNENESNQ